MKRELNEKLNSKEIYSKTNFKLKYKIKKRPKKAKENNYIINNIVIYKNNKNSNVSKGQKEIKYFTFIQKKFNLPLLIIFILVINLIIPIFSSKNIGIGKLSFLNEITIKIIGTDAQSILNQKYSYQPDEIYIQNISYEIDEQNRIMDLINYENNITMKWKSNLIDCKSMFAGLTNIIEIDLSNFDISEVISMNGMFQNCFNLEYIKFNNSIENKLKVNDISNMFENCNSLKTLDLSNLDTSNVINMMLIFSNCWSMTSLNLDRINTSSVMIFLGVFYNCSSLESLDLSSFDTSNSNIMNYMFFNCSSLTSLNLSNFKTSYTSTMAGMFYNCVKLKYLDLSNFDTSSSSNFNNLFSNCTELISLDISNFNTTKANSISEMFSNCNNLQYINISNFIGKDNINDSDLLIGVPENITYCFNKESEITQLFENLRAKNCSINDCSNDWITKERKMITEKNMCVYDCSEDDTYKNEFKNKCYIDCPEGTYLSNENNKCIIICEENLPYEMNEECVSNCSTVDFFINKCKISNQNINAKEKMIDIILNEISDGSANILLSKVLNQDKKDYLINNNNSEIFHITSLSNQKKNEYNNISSIDIGECEDILKEVYQINTNETLILFKTDFYIEEYMIPITEYEIYNPQTKEKLDLSYCKGNTLKIYSPVSVSIDEKYLYKYDPNSDYYKDKCYLYTSECVNDDILEERKNEFNNNYLSLCEGNCEFIEYNKTTQKVLCECPFKSEFMKLSEIINKKDKLLYYNFKLEIDNLNTNSYSDSNYNTNNINSKTNFISNKTDIINLCLFKEKKTLKCEESISFEDLINQKYIPLNSIHSIKKVFELFDEHLNNKSININKDEIIEGEDVIYQITETTKKLKKNNNSYIDLGECETILKKQCGIEEPLIIFMVDIKRNDTISTQVEYQVYNPHNFEKLNLTYCENVKIDIYSPTYMDVDVYNLAKYLKENGYDIFDSSDDFYNDICSSFTSYNNTDVILNDRRKDFYNPNITLCEDNCQYKEFNIETLKVKCQCNVKTSVNDTTEIKFSPNKIIENFYKLEKYANLKIIVCYNQVFNLSKLKKNYGSYFIIIIGLLFIITMIIVFLTIEKKINGILKNIKTNFFPLNKQLNRKDKNKKKDQNEIISKKHISLNKNKSSIFKAYKAYKNSKIKNENSTILNSKRNINKLINNPNKKIKKKNNINYKNKKKKLNIKNLNECKKNSKALLNMKNLVNSISEKMIVKNSPSRYKKTVKNNNINNIFIFSNKINKHKNFLIIKNDKNKENGNFNFIDKIIDSVPKNKRYKYFIDEELNSFEYKDALNIDTRSFFQMYYSLLRQNHLIIFTFFVKNDYNTFLLKFALFLLSLSLFFFMNAIFFKDESLHKIYEDQGKYNILYQIPQILYSTIVSQIISSLLEKLSLSQDEIINIKEKFNLKKKINQEVKNVIKYITIKCTLFFIVSIIFLFGFWYYLSAFCAVYYNTQKPLMKDNIISFATSMLYPFFLILFPVILRIISLRKEIKCLYIFSNIMIKIIGIID